MAQGPPGVPSNLHYPAAVCSKTDGKSPSEILALPLGSQGFLTSEPCYFMLYYQVSQNTSLHYISPQLPATLTSLAPAVFHCIEFSVMQISTFTLICMKPPFPSPQAARERRGSQYLPATFTGALFPAGRTRAAQSGVFLHHPGSATGKFSRIKEGSVGLGAAPKLLYEAHSSGGGLDFRLIDEASPNELGCMFSNHLPPAKKKGGWGGVSPKPWDFS